MKIYVDTDSDIRLARRLKRDITERGRDVEGVLKQYSKFVKPATEHYIEPTMSIADIIVPRGKNIQGLLSLPLFLISVVMNYVKIKCFIKATSETCTLFTSVPHLCFQRNEMK